MSQKRSNDDNNPIDNKKKVKILDGYNTPPRRPTIHPNILNAPYPNHFALDEIISQSNNRIIWLCNCGMINENDRCIRCNKIPRY